MYFPESFLCSAIIFTIAEPMIAPSATSVIFLADSEFLIPNPTHTGRSVYFFISFAIPLTSVLIESLTPVTPKDETK